MKSLSRGGVFEAAVDARVEQFTESISFDHLLYAHDIAGSIAHAQMLATVDLVTAEEAASIEKTLLEIKAEIDAGEFEFKSELEDIHMNIEQALIDRLGDVGRKLHTARSRNDQIATDLRLWCRDEIDQLIALLTQLQKSFVGRCDKDANTILPAYTHLQRAQPVLASHYWLAYCEKLERDKSRLIDCRKRLNNCSLGTAALAGTTLPINRQEVAAKLGFEGISQNSIDVSSDRDFVVEFAFCMTLIAEHLSTLAEEWILWSTVEYQFIKLPQKFCTGSSIMPQKVNPDVMELIRGKTARVVGNLQTLLVLIKGLPLAYNRDLQEDKLPLFDSVKTVQQCLALAAPIVSEAEIRTDSIATRLEAGFLDATTLMEYLIKRDLPQRTAHHVVGALVAKAMDQGKSLSELSLKELKDADERIEKDVYDVLGVENSVKAFVSEGSTGPDQVAKQIKAWKQRLLDA